MKIRNKIGLIFIVITIIIISGLMYYGIQLKRNENKLITPKDSDRIDSVNRKRLNGSRQKRRWDTLYISGNKDAYVIGDSLRKQINYIAIKFEPYISFSDFPANSIKNNRKMAIDWTSNKEVKRFKTRISETYKNEGVNFAGHYCFIYWGCGSPCQSSAVVDAITGKIYNGLNAALGYDYKSDSRMIIVNPPDSTGYYLDCPYCKPLIFIWDENKKQFNKR